MDRKLMDCPYKTVPHKLVISILNGECQVSLEEKITCPLRCKYLK
jgi:hypothetical protein